MQLSLPTLTNNTSSFRTILNFKLITTNYKLIIFIHLLATASFPNYDFKI